jgi:hypothetical protein
MFAGPVYVGFRTYRPDEETFEKVKEKLQENDIDVSQLIEWPVDNCLEPESYTAASSHQ